jgi:hypothetical protein
MMHLLHCNWILQHQSAMVYAWFLKDLILNILSWVVFYQLNFVHWAVVITPSSHQAIALQIVEHGTYQPLANLIVWQVMDAMK